jgi:predicted lipid-binding transport protein (Tim44 family)
MNSAIIQLLVLAGIAIFLILRLRNVLGTREGFEKPRVDAAPTRKDRSGFEVIEGGIDPDITDHVPEKSESAEALARMKRVEPTFGVGEFLGGARGAYEMILMAFENGDLDSVRSFMSDDVNEAFEGVISARKDQGLSVEANFIGVRELELVNADFNDETSEAEVTVKFVGELTSVVRDKAGDIVEGDPVKAKRQRDVWTFAREMGSDNPNWYLVATGV